MGKKEEKTKIKENNKTKNKIKNKEKIIFMSNQKFEDEKIIQKLELTQLEEPVLTYISK